MCVFWCQMRFVAHVLGSAIFGVAVLWQLFLPCAHRVADCKLLIGLRFGRRDDGDYPSDVEEANGRRNVGSWRRKEEKITNS